MKYEEISELLDRYWEGETTLEEERTLKAYFNGGNLDARLLAIAPMFQAIREEQALEMTRKAKVSPMRPQMYLWAAAASIALILVAGWWMFREEQKAPQMAIKTPVEQPQVIQKQAIEPKEAAVAGVEVPATIKLVPTKKRSRKTPKPSPEIDPETAQAMAEIKAALALVSAKLDKGRNKAIKGATYLEAMDKIPKRDEG